jgi:acetyl-CoA carboxylase biotin carboxyl carrier protein
MPPNRKNVSADESPFKKYRAAMRIAQEEAAKNRGLTDALAAQEEKLDETLSAQEEELGDTLNTQEADIADELKKQTKQADDALRTLEKTIPRWWQMGELTSREVPYEQFETWQKKGWELINSAQKDFFSGEATRIQQGSEKVQEAHAMFQNMKGTLLKTVESLQEETEELEDQVLSSLENEISKAEKQVGKYKKKLNTAKSKTRKVKKEREEGKASDRMLASIYAAPAGLIGFFGGCVSALGSGSAFGTGLTSAAVVAVITWFVLYGIFQAEGKNGSSLHEAKREEEKLGKQLAEAENQLNELQSLDQSAFIASDADVDEKRTELNEMCGYIKATSLSNTSSDSKGLVQAVLVRTNEEGTFHRAPDPYTDAYIEPGDKVEPGEVLCTVETKPAGQVNEIRCEAAGTVEKIFAKRSQSVKRGHLLLVIEQESDSRNSPSKTRTGLPKEKDEASRPAKTGSSDAKGPRRRVRRSVSGNTFDAPIAGTFYRCPSSDSDPYVELGDTVKAGDVLCIIETMKLMKKLMNEIECETPGTVEEILVKDGEPVEHEQPLFVIGNADT